MVDGDEYPEGGTAVAIDEGKELVGRGVVVFGLFGQGAEHRSVILLKCFAFCDGVELIWADSEVM